MSHNTFIVNGVTHTFTEGEILKYHGLNLRQFVVIHSLKHGSMTLTELAKEARCSTAAMTGLKDKLVEMGFIKCFESTTDRRRSVVSLLPPGFKATQYFIGRFICAQLQPNGDGGSPESGK